MRCFASHLFTGGVSDAECKFDISFTHSLTLSNAIDEKCCRLISSYTEHSMKIALMTRTSVTYKKMSTFENKDNNNNHNHNDGDDDDDDDDDNNDTYL